MILFLVLSKVFFLINEAGLRIYFNLDSLVLHCCRCTMRGKWTVFLESRGLSLLASTTAILVKFQVLKLSLCLVFPVIYEMFADNITIYIASCLINITNITLNLNFCHNLSYIC